MLISFSVTFLLSQLPLKLFLFLSLAKQLPVLSSSLLARDEE